MTASDDWTGRIWSVATGAQLLELDGHEGAVLSAVFSPDGTRIVTASDDKSARIWDAATGAQLQELIGHEGAVYSAALSRDGARVITASEDKTAIVWDTSAFERGDAFLIACRRLGSDIGLADVEARYGLSKLPPICGNSVPLQVDQAHME